MSRVINKSTMIPLPDVTTRLNPHIEQMNTDRWELMSASIETIGIQELLILFWKKFIEE